MAKFREMVYMCLDLLKESGDDAFYTEEHVLFLLTKFRALLLERKYRNARNQTFSEMSEQNRQQICLDLEPTEILPYGCSGEWLKSTKQVPELLGESAPRVSVVNDLMHSQVTYVAPERMPYVGYNKWLRHIIYASRSLDGYLYLTSNNPQFINLESIKLDAVFSNPDDAAALSCDDNGEKEVCDVMDKEFPLEDALIPSCIELVVQELAPARYAPEDRQNNDRDDLGRAGMATMRTPRGGEAIASRLPSRRRTQQQEQEEA